MPLSIKLIEQALDAMLEKEEDSLTCIDAVALHGCTEFIDSQAKLLCCTRHKGSNQAMLERGLDALYPINAKVRQLKIKLGNKV